MLTWLMAHDRMCHIHNHWTILCRVVLLLFYFVKVAKSNYDVLRMAAEPLCIGLNLSRSSLRKLVQQNGYRFRCVDKRRILIEKPAVVVVRATFLRTMRKIRAVECFCLCFVAVQPQVAALPSRWDIKSIQFTVCVTCVTCAFFVGENVLNTMF